MPTKGVRLLESVECDWCKKDIHGSCVLVDRHDILRRVDVVFHFHYHFTCFNEKNDQRKAKDRIRKE